MPSNCTCDMSNEREFIEGLVNSRFRFFVIFISIIIAGSSIVKNEFLFKVVLTFGFVISFLIALTIARSQQKLNIIFNLLPDEHPAIIVNEEAKKNPFTRSVRNVIGYYIPAICCLFLLLLSLLAWFNVIMPTE